MQPEAREKLFSVAQKEKRNGSISYAVASVESKKIDAEGIATAITAAVDKSLVKLNVDPLQCLVLLDGGLRAPKRYVYQKTIVRGDDSEPIISLASVIAKVVRDRKMRMYARVYGGYGFEVHKGYGTRHHLDAIDRLGMCAIHRRSFCKKSLQRK
jgi:ribonuclease HII